MGVMVLRVGVGDAICRGERRFALGGMGIIGIRGVRKGVLQIGLIGFIIRWSYNHKPLQNRSKIKNIDFIVLEVGFNIIHLRHKVLLNQLFKFYAV